MPYEQFFDDDVYFVLDQHAKLDFYSVSSLKQQSTGRYVAPLRNITVKSLLFVEYQFSWFSWVGWSTKLRIQQTMKLGKQFSYAVLEWPRLSGPAA